MTENFSRDKKTINYNLSQNIPYTIKLDKKNLIFIKGVIQGRILIESLILELAREFSLAISNINIIEQSNQDVVIKIENHLEMSLQELDSVIKNTISRELPFTLTNKDTKKPLVYITQDLVGIPLIGSLYFGIIDRGTNLLQIRSITGCPLNCPFCSVDEGPATKTKLRDFIVDTDFLVDSYNFVVKEKDLKKAEAHLDGQGEPMANPYLVDLVSQLNSNPITKTTSIQTNGWYLSEKLIDELEEVGLSRINLSINTLDLAKGKKLAGRAEYPLERILELAKYIAESKIALLLAPVWISSINDEDMEEIINFSLEINSQETRFPILGLQNYLIHHQGRNMKGITSKKFSEFNAQLRAFEKKYGIDNLILKPYMFDNYKTNMLKQTMERNQKILADVILPGRVENEVIAKAHDRLIHIDNGSDGMIGKKVEVRILRNKHNIYFGKIL